MQRQPSLDDLLGAVTALLDDPVTAAVADPGVRFRVRIAANLIEQVRLELRDGTAMRADERARLVAAAPAGFADLGTAGDGDAIAALESALAAGVRDRTISDDALAPIRAALQATRASHLARMSPRFVLDADIEAEPS